MFAGAGPAAGVSDESAGVGMHITACLQREGVVRACICM